MTNAFYHCIQKLCVQCQFSDEEEQLVDAIIHGTKVQKAREKLLQMPEHLTLCDCLKICHNYELLQYHLNVVKPTDKPVESITKHHFNRGGKQQSTGAKKSGTFRSQSTDKTSNSANNITQCSYCSTTHANVLLIMLLASNVIGLVTFLQCAEAVPVLPRIQGNLTGFVAEAEHPRVEDLLQEDKSMK